MSIIIEEVKGISCFVLYLKNPINNITSLETNAPRFTLGELRQVLWERNDLKTKLLEVEEELRFFKEQ